MLEIISGIFSAGTVGAIGGLARTYLEGKAAEKTAAIELEKTKADNAHSLELKKLDIEELRFAQEHELQVRSVEGEQAEQQNSWDALKASYENDKATYATTPQASGWLVAVDFLRGITRPGITWVLDFAVIALVFLALRNSSATELAGVAKDSAKQLLDIAAMATGWWFATRPHTIKKGE